MQAIERDQIVFREHRGKLAATPMPMPVPVNSDWRREV
jgi:hypothetical protein